MRTSDKIAILVAIIGLAGTIIGALIASGYFKSEPPGGPGNEIKNLSENLVGTDKPKFAPHAPEIQVGTSEVSWGEDTMLVEIDAGKRYELEAQKLYSEATTFPPSSCRGPGFIVYTWQVREPYPEGGDLEIRSIIPQAGGPTELKARGAMGRTIMSPCGIDYLVNRGLQPIKVELRYATAVDPSAVEYDSGEAPTAAEDVEVAQNIDVVAEAAENAAQ